MTAEHAQREPTMEEILASIRRIISEEDQPAETGGDVLQLAPQPAVETRAPAPKPQPSVVQPAVAQPAPAPPKVSMPAPDPVPAFSAVEDDLIVEDFDDEDDRIEIAAPETAPPAVVAPAAQVVPSAPAAPARPVFRAQPDEGLIGEPAASAAAGSLGKLMGSMLISSGNTLDDVVRALLKPMLKEWLDAHLPAIVEMEVEKEIERIRRLAR